MTYIGLLVAGTEVHRIRGSNKRQLEETLNRIRGSKNGKWQILNERGLVLAESKNRKEVEIDPRD
jgi:hypothetical protein